MNEPLASNSSQTRDPSVHTVDPDQRLHADVVSKDLKGRFFRSGLVMLVSHTAAFVIGVGSTMVLARLLTPRDFGLLAIVSLLTNFVGSIKDFGLPMAAVQKDQLNQKQMSGLFWLSMKLNLLVVLAMFALAPVLAWFFGEPSVRAITWAITVGVFVSGLAHLHLGLLKRQMKFGVISLIKMGSLSISTVVAIVCALLGAGYWALVAQQVTLLGAEAVAAWGAARWRPGHFRDVADQSDTGLQSMWSYGKHLTYARILGFLSRDVSRILIGRFAGATPLGLFDMAFRWSIFPVRQIHLPMLSVVVATFSRLQDAPERYRRYFREVSSVMYAVTLPTLAFLFVDARQVILVLLGDQWLGVVPIFKVLLVATLGYGTTRMAKWVYLSEGRLERQVRWSLIATPVTICGVAVGIVWGALGVALGYMFASCALIYPSVRYCLVGSSLKMRDVWSPAILPGLATAVAVLAVLGWRRLMPTGSSVLIGIAIDLAAFCLVYSTCWLASSSGRARVHEMGRLLRSFRHSSETECDG